MSPHPAKLEPHGKEYGPACRSLAELTERNIEIVAHMEGAAQAHRKLSDRLADAISRFAGSVGFVYLHVAWYTSWILWNSLPLIPQAYRIDPFPFTFLTFIVSLEAIFLSTFILISQNHEMMIAERRNHLDLQINLLSEQENSKMLAMLQSIQEHLGIATVDPEVRVMEEITEPERLVEQIEAVVGRKGKTRSTNTNGDKR